MPEQKHSKTLSSPFVKRRSIILTGGGTAGHVWPHFALFDTPKSPVNNLFQTGNLDVHYFGSSTGLERDIVKTVMPSWHYHTVATGKLRRYFSVKNFFDPFRVFLGIWQAFLLIRKIKPSVVFSKGGFVSAPVVWGAWLNGVPVVIHESDATLALATKLTMPFCQKILCAFPETIQTIPKIFKKKALAIGLPLRASLFSISKDEGRKHFQIHNDKKVILIFGGSLGARNLNQSIYEVLPTLCERYNVIHITGKNAGSSDTDLSSRGATTRSTFSHPDYKQFAFLKEDMKFAYGACDLAICRAGASSIFELACARIPMILIPLGLEASRGDQIINANIFVKKGWAESFDEKLFKGDLILESIEKNIKMLNEKKSALNSAPSVESSEKTAHILFEYLK